MFELKTVEYEIYPAGQDTAHVKDVRFESGVETSFGIQDQVILVIESDSELLPDERSQLDPDEFLNRRVGIQEAHT